MESENGENRHFPPPDQYDIRFHIEEIQLYSNPFSL